MGNLGNGLEIGHVVARVADALDVDGLGLVVDSGLNVLGLVTVHKLGVDSETRQEHLELVVSASVQVGSGYNVVAGVRERVDSDELGALARRSSESCDTTLECSNALFKDINGGLLRMIQQICWNWVKSAGSLRS